MITTKPSTVQTIVSVTKVQPSCKTHSHHAPYIIKRPPYPLELNVTPSYANFTSSKTASHHGTSIIGSGDSPEPLLTGGVPDLEFDLLTLDLHRSDLEVDPCGGVYTINVMEVTRTCTCICNDGSLPQSTPYAWCCLRSHFF